MKIFYSIGKVEKIELNEDILHENGMETRLILKAICFWKNDQFYIVFHFTWSELILVNIVIILSFKRNE